MMKKRVILVAVVVSLFAVCLAAAAQFWIAVAVYADNSCRTTSGSFDQDGVPCRFPGLEVWCDPAASTCLAADAPPPAMPICGDRPSRERAGVESYRPPE
jgi:hypothetical protein